MRKRFEIKIFIALAHLVALSLLDQVVASPQCEAGKKSVVGANSSSVCVNCSVNTYSMANGSACAACPSNSVSG